MAVKIAEQLNLSGTSVWKCLRQLMTSSSTKSHHAHTIQATTQLKLVTFHNFDTHILGVLGAPLPAINLHSPAVMLNVLGQHVESAETYVTENPSAHLHMYGKLEAKHNRKMGHVTLFSNDPDNVVEFGKGIDF